MSAFKELLESEATGVTLSGGKGADEDRIREIGKGRFVKEGKGKREKERRRWGKGERSNSNIMHNLEEDCICI